MPKGTFLTAPQPKFSNPATRADGGQGGGSGENPPKYNPSTSPTSAGGYVLPQVPVQGGGGTGATDQPTLGDKNYWVNSFWNPKSPADFYFGVRGWWNSLPGNQPQQQQFYNAGGVPIQGYKNVDIWNGKEEVSYNPVAFDRQGNRYSWDANSNKYVRDETGAFAQNPLQKTPNAPGNDLVGQNIDSAPTEMTGSQALQLFPNMTPTQVAEQMRARGYENKYLPGVGGIWVKTSEPTQSPAASSGGGSAVSNQVDNRGRPTWVDPTLLKPGERVTSASGLTFVGGTPTAQGNAQYAITVPQSAAVANDKHGNFKWESKVSQNDNGDWVRVYYKALRKVRTAKGRRRIAERGAEQQQQAAPAPAPTPQATGDAEALVTLRANYG